MALYRSRYRGVTSEGSGWSFTTWATSSATLSTVQAAAVQWFTDLWTGYAPYVATTTIAQLVDTGEVDQSTGKQSEVAEDTISMPGSSASGPMPADVALVVSLRTLFRSRSGRGRFFLPQPAVNALATTGRLDSDAQEAIADAAQTAYNGFVGTGVPVIYGRVAKSTTAVVSLDVGDLFDTQRRREKGLTESRTSRTIP